MQHIQQAMHKGQGILDTIAILLGGVTVGELTGILDLMTQLGQVIMGFLTTILVLYTIYNRHLEVKIKKKELGE